MSHQPIVYISPAVPARKRFCPDGTDVGELIARYLDELCCHLTALGVPWRRNATDMRGAAGVMRAVEQSNACGASLHYTARTADGVGSGGLLLVAPAHRPMADTLARHRQPIVGNEGRMRLCEDMYEMVYADAPCLYEYLAHHENAADVQRLRAETPRLAAATARAFCDILRALPA